LRRRKRRAGFDGIRRHFTRRVGEEGLRTALSIAESLFKLAPQIRAEAKLTYRVPRQLRPLFLELKQRFDAAEKALLQTATRLEQDCTEHLAEARSELLTAAAVRDKIVADLPRLVAHEDRQHLAHFDEWSARLDQLRKSTVSIESSSTTIRCLKKSDSDRSR
jgi:histidyl-tRNA synthetase